MDVHKLMTVRVLRPMQGPCMTFDAYMVVKALQWHKIVIVKLFSRCFGPKLIAKHLIKKTAKTTMRKLSNKHDELHLKKKYKVSFECKTISYYYNNNSKTKIIFI